MTDESGIRSALTAIDQQMRKMIAGEIQPYEAGTEIWRVAMANAPEATDIMWPLWLIWGALTDWIENKPEEQPRAEEEMLRASREWLSLNPKDRKARTEYLDRWVYDEMGYERKNE